MVQQTTLGLVSTFRSSQVQKCEPLKAGQRTDQISVLGHGDTVCFRRPTCIISRRTPELFRHAHPMDGGGVNRTQGPSMKLRQRFLGRDIDGAGRCRKTFVSLTRNPRPASL